VGLNDKLGNGHIIMLPLLLVLPACMALNAAPSLVVAEQAPLPEYYAKARIIRLLLDYVDWPGEKADQPIVVGVLEPSPFGDHLPRALDKVVVRGGRPLQVRFLRSPSSVSGCDALFIPEGLESSLNSILRDLRDRPVLTIADTPGFARKGVIVNLAIADRRVRLEVNLAAMKRSGLMISPQVLKGATIVD